MRSLISITKCCLILVLLLGYSSCKNQQQSSENKSEKVSENKALLIDGSWELNYIQGNAYTLSELYGEYVPTLIVNSKVNKVSGNASCNQYSGTLTLDGKKFQVSSDLISTKKLCPKMDGEDLFLKNLPKVTAYSITDRGRELNLISGDIAIMRFQKK